MAPGPGQKAGEILKRDGLNEIKEDPKPTLLMLFIMQLVSFIIMLLIVAAGASGLLEGAGCPIVIPGSAYVATRRGSIEWCIRRASALLGHVPNSATKKTLVVDVAA